MTAILSNVKSSNSKSKFGAALERLSAAVGKMFSFKTVEPREEEISLVSQREEDGDPAPEAEPEDVSERPVKSGFMVVWGRAVCFAILAMIALYAVTAVFIFIFRVEKPPPPQYYIFTL